MPDGSEGVAAAEAALARGEFTLAEALAADALRSADSLAVRLTLAQALAWQGRGRDADAVLAEVDPATLDAASLMAWALPRAANQFWMLDEPERATAFLRATRDRVRATPAGATIDALLGTFAMNAGSPQRATELAESVLTARDADDQAIGWAASAAALCHARMGRLDDVDELAHRAVTAGHPGLLRFTSGLGQTTALLMSGQLARARGLADELVEQTQGQQPGHAIGQVLLADVLVSAGEVEAAVPLLEAAAAALAPTGYSWGPLAWMSLAQALGQLGRVADAGRVLARAERRHGLKSMLFAPELCMARAWVSHARRDGPAAIAAAREAARAAARGGQSAVAVRALIDGVRLGDARAFEVIERLGVDAVVARIGLAYARSYTARDEPGLRLAASSFAEIGMHGVAADARTQAERLHESQPRGTTALT